MKSRALRGAGLHVGDHPSLELQSGRAPESGPPPQRLVRATELAELPLRGSTRELGTDGLIAEAEAVCRLPIRHVLVADAEATGRLRPGFLEGGYREAALVTVVLRRPPDREADKVSPPSATLCR